MGSALAYFGMHIQFLYTIAMSFIYIGIFYGWVGLGVLVLLQFGFPAFIFCIDKTQTKLKLLFWALNISETHYPMILLLWMTLASILSLGSQCKEASIGGDMFFGWC